jgi:very-short-patch-repair endonuclease
MNSRQATTGIIAGRTWEGAYSKPERREQARALRRHGTDAERSFWERVRAHRFEGTKWRRQHPIGPFIVDFYCREWRIVVELDGTSHDEMCVRDEQRDAFITATGVRVVRVSNDDWFADPDAVLDAIAAMGRSAER